MNEVIYALVGGLVGSVIASILGLGGVFYSVWKQGKTQLEVVREQGNIQIRMMDRQKKTEAYKEMIKWISRHDEGLQHMLRSSAEKDKSAHIEEFIPNIYRPAMDSLNTNRLFLSQDLFEETGKYFIRISKLREKLGARSRMLDQQHRHEQAEQWYKEVCDSEKEERIKSYKLIKKYKDDLSSYM